MIDGQQAVENHKSPAITIPPSIHAKQATTSFIVPTDEQHILFKEVR